MRLKFKKKLKKNKNENEKKGLIIEPNKKEEPERDWFTKQYEKAIGKPPPRAKLTTDEVLERLKELAKNVRANEAESVKSPEPQSGPVDYFKWSEPRIKTCKCPDDDCSCQREAMFPSKKIPRGERYFNSPLSRKLRRFFKKPAPAPSKGFMERLADVAGVEADMYKDLEKKGILNKGGAEFCPSRCTKYYRPGHVPNYNKHLIDKENLRYVPQVPSTSVTVKNKKDMYKCDGGDKHSTVSTQSTIGPEGKLTVDNFSHVLFGTLEEYIVNHIDGTELRMSFYKCGNDDTQSATVNICLDKMLSLRDHLNMQELKTHVSMLKQKIYSSVFDIKTKRPDVRSLPTQYEEEELKKNSSEKITIATPYKGVVIKVKKKPEECITISQVELNLNQQQNNENDNILPTEASLKSNDESNKNKTEILPNKENKSDKIQSYNSINEPLNSVSSLQKATVCDSLQNKLVNNMVDLQEGSRMDLTTPNLNKSYAPSSNSYVTNEIDQNKEELQIKEYDNILLVPASKPSNVSNDSSKKIMSMLKKLKQSISKKSQSSSFMNKRHNFVSTINEKSSDYVLNQLAVKPSEIHQSPHMEVLEKDMEDKSSLTNKHKDLTNDNIENINQLQNNEFDSIIPEQDQLAVNTSEIHQCRNTDVLEKYMEYKSSITSKHKDLTDIENLNQLQNNKYDSILPQPASELKNILNESITNKQKDLTNDTIKNLNQLQKNEYDSIMPQLNQITVNTSEIHQSQNTEDLNKDIEDKSSITNKHKDLTNDNIENINQLQNNEFDSIFPEQDQLAVNTSEIHQCRNTDLNKDMEDKSSITNKHKNLTNDNIENINQLQNNEFDSIFPEQDQLAVNTSEIHQCRNTDVLEKFMEYKSSITSKHKNLTNTAIENLNQLQNNKYDNILPQQASELKNILNESTHQTSQKSKEWGLPMLKKLKQSISKKNKSRSSIYKSQRSVSQIQNEKTFDSLPKQLTVNISEIQQSSNMKVVEKEENNPSISSKSDGLANVQSPSQRQNNECGKVSNKTSRIKNDQNHSLQNKTQNISKKSRSGSNTNEPFNCTTSILNENVCISSHKQISIKTSKKQTLSNIFTEEDIKKKSSMYSKNNILTDGAAPSQHKLNKQHINEFNNVLPKRSKSSESVKKRKSESEAMNDNDLLLKKSNTQELSILAKLQRNSNKKQLHSFIKESLNYVSSRHMEFTVEDMGQKCFMSNKIMSNKSNDRKRSIMGIKDILIEMKQQRSNLDKIEFKNSNNSKNSKDIEQKPFMSNKSIDLNRTVMEKKKILKQNKQHQSNLAMIEFENSNKSQDKILTGNKEKYIETPTPLVSRMYKLFNRLFNSPYLHESYYKKNKVNDNKAESNAYQYKIASNDETNRSKETQEYIFANERTHTEPDKNSHLSDNFNENVNTNKAYNSRNLSVPSYQATVNNEPDTSNEKYFEVNVSIKNKIVNESPIKHPYLTKTTTKSSILSNMLFWKKNCYVKSLPDKLQNDSLKQSHNQKYMSEVQPKRCLKSSERKKNDEPKTSEKEIFSYQYSTMGEVKSTL